jgi:hypothetical protein
VRGETVGRLVLIALVAALAVWSGANVAGATPSIAYRLAAIDCQCKPKPAAVVPYQRLLEKLVAHKCKEKASRLAGEVVATRNIIAKDGYGEHKLIELLRALNTAIPNSIGFKQNCAGVLAALIVLMEK